MNQAQLSQVIEASQKAKIPVTRSTSGVQRYSVTIAGRSYTDASKAISAITSQYLKRR